MTTQVRTIATPHGDARLHTDRSRHPAATLVLNHGAGRGEDSPDLVALAQSLPGQGISVFRIEQPWHVAGMRVAARPPVLDAVTVACVNGIRARTPMVLGGRSAGARVACRLASSLGAVGCLALAFPLHPPRKPQSTRLPELLGANVATFVVQGERDAFGGPESFPEGLELTAIPEADHGFKVPTRAALSQEETLALVVEAVVEWVTARVG
ncbi:MAG: hydrolase [Propionibacteriales bacterium]|nr:hydrolase [Propionibacteriales bacterium]